MTLFYNPCYTLLKLCTLSYATFWIGTQTNVNLKLILLIEVADKQETHIMSSKNIKIIITIYIINVFIVSRNQALQSKEKNKYQYDLDTSYPDYELLDKNIDSTSKIDFTPVELLKSVVTNTVGITKKITDNESIFFYFFFK